MATYLIKLFLFKGTVKETVRMKVDITQESGYEWAALGMSLSFKDRLVSIKDWWTPERFEQMKRVMERNANRGLGHNKFRRQIIAYVMIEAPRFWWSEFDTYKIGTTTQSESTMHTLSKRLMVKDDLENPDEYDIVQMRVFNDFKVKNQDATIEELKRKVPESYLQRRLVTLNYEVLATMINQRKNHRLPQWKYFIEEIYKQVEHPELLPEYPYKGTCNAV